MEKTSTNLLCRKFHITPETGKPLDEIIPKPGRRPMSIVMKTHCIQPDRKENAKMNAHGMNSLKSRLKERQPEALEVPEPIETWTLEEFDYLPFELERHGHEEDSAH